MSAEINPRQKNVDGELNKITAYTILIQVLKKKKWKFRFSIISEKHSVHFPVSSEAILRKKFSTFEIFCLENQLCLSFWTFSTVIQKWTLYCLKTYVLKSKACSFARIWFTPLTFSCLGCIWEHRQISVGSEIWRCNLIEVSHTSKIDFKEWKQSIFQNW